MDNKLQLMTGVDIPIPELQTALHQPSITEISYIGDTIYFSVISTFCFNKDILIAQNPQGTSNLASMNNFQIFMTMITEAKAVRTEDLLSVFTMLFPGYTAQILPRSIFFNNPNTKHGFTLDERSFDTVADIIKEISGQNGSTSGQNGGFNPKGKKAAEIAAKLMKGRQKAANSKGEKEGSILSRYVSILTVALESMSLKDCLNLTVYQLYDLIERYGLYTSWDLDIKSRLAGGKPDSKPDDWMKNIH